VALLPPNLPFNLASSPAVIGTAAMVWNSRLGITTCQISHLKLKMFWGSVLRNFYIMWTCHGSLLPKMNYQVNGGRSRLNSVDANHRQTDKYIHTQREKEKAGYSCNMQHSSFLYISTPVHSTPNGAYHTTLIELLNYVATAVSLSHGTVPGQWPAEESSH